MTLTIQSIHFTASDRLKSYVQRKTDKLDQFFDRIVGAKVNLKLHNNGKGANKVVEIKLAVPGDILIASEKGTTFEEATDLVTDKIRKQLTRYKERLKARA